MLLTRSYLSLLFLFRFFLEQLLGDKFPRPVDCLGQAEHTDAAEEAEDATNVADHVDDGNGRRHRDQLGLT